MIKLIPRKQSDGHRLGRCIAHDHRLAHFVPPSHYAVDFGRFGRLAASTVELLWRCARLAQSAHCGCRSEHSYALYEISACSAHDSFSFIDSAGGQTRPIAHLEVTILKPGEAPKRLSAHFLAKPCTGEEVNPGCP